MRHNEKGQALVLVLLSLAVVLTLVLFILSRSVTDVAVSSRQEESVRAFSAAEAGIERGLVIGVSGGAIQIGDASYTANSVELAEGSADYNYPINLGSGDSSTTWFVAHDTDGNLICDASNPCFTGNTVKVCWGKAGTSSGASTTPAVEVSVFYSATPGNYATTKIGRGVYDPNSTRRGTNSFAANDAGTCTIGGVTYQFAKTITLSSLGVPATAYQNQNGLLFLRTRMLYNTDQNHEMGVTVNFGGNSVLPSQGQSIVSTGTAGESNRKLQVFQGWPEVPSVFDFAVYSSNGLTK